MTAYRALYTEEYRKTHPGVTVGEFGAVWGTVDKETRKVCPFFIPVFLFDNPPDL
jgi:hypothetical protein